ncbi:SOS response-associated peptidase [Kiritimatiella glycovorans]|uniref:Abasic site processing protein n=1 Tax=Kiritimatiella glycovorans TaxID=1307763 RepID=A0A0G3ED42_9BACT|nr:SOS response-associated peptidase [Kiritimatiella glycovorans]AKJ64238.1 hypothetical protein L21SP4_00978 [Kiritimatiella glycovorans]
MCGRFTRTAKASAVEETIAPAAPGTPLEPRYNIAPTQSVAILLNDDPGQLVRARWSLLFPWDETGDGPTPINLRLESVEQKKGIRRMFRERRCLVPADGFYEWRREGAGDKQPFYFHLPGRPLFYFPGIWSQRPESGPTFALLTAPASETVRPVHPRMPLMLALDHRDLWLGSTLPDPGILRDVANSFDLHRYPVSPAVNRPDHEGPELIGRRH